MVSCQQQNASQEEVRRRYHVFFPTMTRKSHASARVLCSVLNQLAGSTHLSVSTNLAKTSCPSVKSVKQDM